ncbi:MAG TPA: sigma-70 family RNA polymerase sigma factor [Opitutaceae bacterium]|nr:sigma-70 family RNA polymerase sigma factor [Opitutaceae bacterium]
MTPSDPELITRVIVNGDRAAFGELVLRHQSAVRLFLRQLTRGDAALADDLAQETFLQAYRGLGRFRGESAFSTWLLGIAHNHWRNARRRQREIAWEAAEFPAPEENVPSPAAAAELKQDLAAALKQLDSDEQTALHLFYQQGLTHPEIAAVAGWPLGTVKTHLARGKEKLRHLLASWNPRT